MHYVCESSMGHVDQSSNGNPREIHGWCFQWEWLDPYFHFDEIQLTDVVGIIRTMVAEMVPEKELQPRAFSVMPLVWNLGSIFGPSFGGFFVNPAENLPGLFKNNKFLIKFPFALPNIVASAFFLIGISTGILFLKVSIQNPHFSLPTDVSGNA
jgi:hypothetical protein